MLRAADGACCLRGGSVRLVYFLDVWIVCPMARAQPLVQLHRLRNLRLIREAVAAIEPLIPVGNIGLEEIAEVVKARATPRAGRCCHDLRDQILTIVADWNLRVDTLEEQSDECLTSLGAFLR